MLRNSIYISGSPKICYINMLQKTLEVLKQFQAQEGANLQIFSAGIIQKRPGNAEVTTQTYDSPVQVSLKDIYESKLNPLNQKLVENGIQADLDTYKEAGGIFKDFGEIDNVFDEGKTHLAHKPGEVLLVDVWATWCGPCQKPMKHNQEMLEKNEGVWGDRVRIVGVSVDEQKEVIKERVTSRKWEKVIHLTLQGWKHDHALIKEFKINGIPFVCLVNKWGKINFTGHPSQINLETRINELLNEQSEVLAKPAAAPSEKNSAKDTIDKVMKLLTKENIQKEFKDAELACFKYNRKQKLQNGVPSTQLTIDAYFSDGDQVTENLIRKLFDKHQGVELKLTPVKYTPIPQVQHPECSLCHAKDLQYPFYWLKWEEGTKFGCRNCVQKKSQVPGHHFAYEKNSVLLLGKWEKVSSKDLGSNIQPQDVSKVEDDHGFGCNGCGGGSQGVGNARYISLGVRADPNFKSGGWVDLCQSCGYKLANKDQAVIDNLAPQGHKDNHPFLRVLYNTKGYYEF